MAMTEQVNSTSRYLLGKDSTGGYVIVMEDCYHAHFGTCVFGYIKKQYNQNKNMKTIVYLHGYGSSSQSGTVAYLAKKMPECRVIAPDIPVDPKEALPFLHEYCKANDADLVIGTSMGGMYAMQLTDYPRICVNPALYMSRLTDILKVGTFDYFQPTTDGRSQYTITEDTIRHFQEMEQHLFDGVTPENQATCWGFFADGDALVNCKSDFAEHFNHVEDFHGEHRMNNNVMRDVIIPAVKKILEFQ